MQTFHTPLTEPPAHPGHVSSVFDKPPNTGPNWYYTTLILVVLSRFSSTLLMHDQVTAALVAKEVGDRIWPEMIGFERLAKYFGVI